MHASRPDLIKAAQFYNEHRFRPLDLTHGHPVCAPTYR